MKKRIIILILFALLVIVYFGVGIVRSLYLESTLITLQMPAKASGMTGTVRVVQLSDLHRAVFGENNQQLVDLVAQKRPDIIITTGDMTDARTREIGPTIALYRRLVEIAPVVYSLGNHELARSWDEVYELLSALTDTGVQCVHNSVAVVEASGLSLRIGGLYHPELYPELAREGAVDILLCHIPDQFPLLAEFDVPLTFAGHTHGGQFRVPVLNIALYAPGQGLFPAYTKGVYTIEDSRMIVSRGLGNSSFPFRVHNPPEVIVADITYTTPI